MVVTDGVEGEKCPLVHFFHWRQMSGDGGWRGCKSVGRALDLQAGVAGSCIAQLISLIVT